MAEFSLLKKLVAQCEMFVYIGKDWERSLPLMICHECHESIPDISRYCLHCGVSLNTSAQPLEDEQIDWDSRILCSDGACTGTIVEGKCTACGLPDPA
ncbi:MAG: hypothetical protein WA133_00055 [Syntrophales bacterium]